MLVKPAPGFAIRDPATMTLVPKEGLEVSADDLYWARALRDGDVRDATARDDAPGKSTPAKAADQGSAG